VNAKSFSFFAASASLHTFLLVGGGYFLNHSAEYGMQAGQNSIEVEMVAAPAETAEDPLPEPVEPTLDIPEESIVLPDPEDFLVPQATQAPARPNPIQAPVILKPKTTNKIGDGSSLISGEDKTTLRSEGGTRTLAKPNYLKNPPPPYPEDARRQSLEGRVRLSVYVNTEGRVQNLEVIQSSGVPSLDQSALRTVRTWRFQPARLGAIPISSTVIVPITFKLN